MGKQHGGKQKPEKDKVKEKKFRGVNRGLESVFELVYCLVLDWILFKILREGWEMIFKD